MSLVSFPFSLTDDYLTAKNTKTADFETNTFLRFDNFNERYNPFGDANLRLVCVVLLSVAV